MRPNKLKSPPLLTANDRQNESSQSYGSKLSTISVGGVANRLITSTEGSNPTTSTTKPMYHSFDTTESSDQPDSFPSSIHQITTDYTPTKRRSIATSLSILLVAILGLILIFLSLICHQTDHKLHFNFYLNDSYFILSLSIGGIFIICSLCKLILSLTTCGPPSYHNVHMLSLFAFISGTISFILSILALSTSSIAGYTLSYPQWLISCLMGYPFILIIIGLLLYILPTDHRRKLHPLLPISTQSDSIDFMIPQDGDTSIPDYIRKYGRMHPFDRSTVKMIWHSFTHSWAWNIIKLGYDRPLQVSDCYDVPNDDHILSQCQIWDHYIKINAIKLEKWSTIQCIWQLEGRSFIFRCCWYMIGLLTSATVPFLISALADFYEDESVC